MNGTGYLWCNQTFVGQKQNSYLLVSKLYKHKSTYYSQGQAILDLSHKVTCQDLPVVGLETYLHIAVFFHTRIAETDVAMMYRVGLVWTHSERLSNRYRDAFEPHVTLYDRSPSYSGSKGQWADALSDDCRHNSRLKLCHRISTAEPIYRAGRAGNQQPADPRR